MFAQLQKPTQLRLSCSGISPDILKRSRTVSESFKKSGPLVTGKRPDKSEFRFYPFPCVREVHAKHQRIRRNLISLIESLSSWQNYQSSVDHGIDELEHQDVLRYAKAQRVPPVHKERDNSVIRGEKPGKLQMRWKVSFDHRYFVNVQPLLYKTSMFYISSVSAKIGLNPSITIMTVRVV